MISSPNLKRRFLKYLLIAGSLCAIAWDLAVSTLSVEPGTFKPESEFESPGGDTTTVAIVTSDYQELSQPASKSDNLSYEQIEEMVDKAIELQGGLDGVIDPGDQVMIKVNLVGRDSPCGQGENTDVRVVKALIRKIASHTEGEVEILVAEGTARTNDDPTDPASVWGNSGYLDTLSDLRLEGINFSLLNLNQSPSDLVEVDLGSRGTDSRQGSIYHVHRAEREADVYIAVPVLKIHTTGITNALKLQVGTAPGCYYGYNKAAGTKACPDGLVHGEGHRLWTTEAIVDLCQVADIDFVVVDAIMCLDLKKTYDVNNQVRFNTILAGADPVAIDHVASKLMGLNPDDIAHITLAEKVGMGTNDPGKIHLAGVPIEQARIRVRKSQVEEGRFGQSNRTWILSQAFEGTDITQEYISGEAALQPIPGEDGWSQPVYFFDDRIDLYSYYSSQSGMVSYAFTYFDARESQEAELWLGTQEAIRVYLNGELVYSFTSSHTYGDADRGEYVCKINLVEGRNTLLVKAVNKSGDYSFALNICEVESNHYYAGNRVEGLRFFIDDQGTSGAGSAAAAGTISLNCYPNPVNGQAKICVTLPRAAITGVKIYDLKGRLVHSLLHKKLQPGRHEIPWDLQTDAGRLASPGVYLCRVESGNYQGCIRLLVK